VVLTRIEWFQQAPQFIMTAFKALDPPVSPAGALLTSDQAAAVLAIAPKTLKNWRTAKRITQPAFCRIGGAVRYRREDLDRFILGSVQENVA
jgi:hypothetical protein